MFIQFFRKPRDDRLTSHGNASKWMIPPLTHIDSYVYTVPSVPEVF